MCSFAIGASFFPHSDSVFLGSHWDLGMGLAVMFLISEIRLCLLSQNVALKGLGMAG